MVIGEKLYFQAYVNDKDDIYLKWYCIFKFNIKQI